MLSIAAFTAFLLVFLLVDLFLFNREAHAIKLKEALLTSVFWVGLALAFNLLVYWKMGPDSAMQFLAGYILEESLSVDNLFVFLVIFSYFRVPSQYQHKVLFWGILGALVMRLAFILAGVALIHRFAWVIYLFGAFLIYTGFKLAFQKEEGVDPRRNPVLRLLRRLLPATASYRGARFLVKEKGRWWATPLLLVLVVVETTDVVFAVDSIPAVLAVTTDPFIVFTSNAFAILSLRAMFFALAGLMGLFHYLRYGLAIVLSFVGMKMLASGWVNVPVGLALAFIAVCLGFSIMASIIWPAGGPEVPLPRGRETLDIVIRKAGKKRRT